MSDPKYERLPHAGDFENKNGTEAFYVSPMPLPTGATPFAGLGMHQDVNDVFLDFASGVSGLEFAVRAYIGSVICIVILFFLFNVYAAFTSLYYGWPFWGNFIANMLNPVIWGVLVILVIAAGVSLYKSLRQTLFKPPVRFNRQRREVVYVREKGQPPLIVPWEEVIACVTAGTLVTQYAVMSSYSLRIGLRDSNSGEVVWLTLSTGHPSLAVSEWEALRVYMEKGPDALPTPLLIDEEFQEGTVAYFHMCRGVYREMHSWPVYAFGFLTIQFCSGWTLPCRFSQWICNRPKAAFPESIREWSKPLPAEQHAQPSAELVQESAEVNVALSQGQSLMDYYKVKFSEPEPMDENNE